MDNNLKGIGGWLILVLIGMIGDLIKTAYDLVDIIESNLPILRITIITYMTGARHPTYGVWFLYDVIFNFLVIIFITCLLILMLTKNRFFPKAAIIYFIVLIFLHGIDYILGYVTTYVDPSLNIANDPSLFIQTLVIAAVVIPYLLLSKRVKATFNTKKDR